MFEEFIQYIHNDRDSKICEKTNLIKIYFTLETKLVIDYL